MTARRVFHLVSSLGPCAVGKRLSLLVPELPVAQRVGCLGEMRPFDERVGAVQLPIRYPADVSGLLAVRRAVQEFRPDIVHAWGPLAVRVAAILRRPRTMASDFDGETGLLATITRNAARGMTRIDLPPCVRIETRQKAPADPPVIVAVGGCDRRSGLRTAIWAFDILKYSWPGLRLLIVGDGPGRAALTDFASALGHDDLRVSFTGRLDDVPDILRTATVVWAPAVAGGVNVVLEAMAAGVPVVAVANPDVNAILKDGQNGRIVPAGDRIALAKATHAILESPHQQLILGENGRTDASYLDVDEVARRLLAAYSGEAILG